MQIEKQHIVSWLALCAKAYEDNQEFLTNLDLDIGDSDHGLNLNRGFKIIAENLPVVEKHNIATILKNTGMILHSNVGGASGPLYGTLFVRAATVVGTREKLSLEQLIDALKSGVDGIVSRGKAEVGDKTMCDVWLPVLEVAKSKIESGCPTDTLLDKIIETAEKSTVATIEMQAKKGRASYLGENSIGHQDPGATSTLLMIKALVHALKSS